MTATLRARRALIAICAVAAPLAAADRYVSGTASGTQDGTAAHPYRQISQAIPGLAPGDVVHIADGTYQGFDIASMNGLSGAPITLQATGAGAVVVATTGTARPDNRDTVLVTMSSWIVIDGLRSSDATRAALRVDQCQHVTVRNCVFDHDARWGIFTDFSDDLLLEGNSCSRSQAEHGIYVSNTCVRPIVRRNRLFSNAANGLHMNGDVSQGGAGVITNALVEFNVIWDNGVGGPTTPPHGGSGINCDGVQDSVIRGNVIYAAHGAGISLYTLDAGAASTGDLIVANTVEVAADGKWCLQLHNGANHATVFDNIFVTRHATRGALHLTLDVDTSTLAMDRNVLGGGTHAVTTDDDTTYLTLAQWQATGHDAHSITATRTALFVAPDAGDYHLAVGSPAIDVGTASFNALAAPTLDADGDTRPGGAGYDIGMDEYVAGGTTTGGSTTGTTTGSTTGGTTTGSTTGGSTTGGSTTGSTTGGSSSGSGGGSHCGAGGGAALVGLGVMAFVRRRR